MSRKIVMTGTLGVMNEANVERFKQTLLKLDPDIDFQFLFDGPQDDETLIKAAKGAEVLITQFQFMTDRIYDGLLPELKAVVSYGIGYNSANLPVATQKGILVCNVPNYCLEEVAVHVVSLLLAEQRKLPNLIKWIEDGKWGGGYKAIAPVKRLSYCTVGLYGFGRIARVVATMLSGFGCRIIAYDAVIPADKIRESGAEPVDFDTLCRESDYISLHVPLLPSTQGVFNREAFAKMKPNCVFINTARGALCDPEALYEALKTGRIQGAAIDAFISEPPAGIEKQIVDLPNVLATPHVGYYSDDSFNDLMDQCADICIKLLDGKDPGTVINAELLKK